MTQHPFDRKYSELDESSNKELMEDEVETIVGGSIFSTATQLNERKKTYTYPSCPLTEAGVWEGGGRFLEL